MKNKILFLVLAFWTLPTSAFAVSFSADDTIAGLGTDVDVRALSPRSQFTAIVTPPYGNEYVVQGQADAAGNASLRIPAQETEMAGSYAVYLEQHGKQLGTAGSFVVLADMLHSANSSISSNTAAIRADGSSTATVQVILRDRYGNPLAGRPVKLISSRASDSVEMLQRETDENGEQQFTVRTFTPGELSLRAIDFMSGEMLASDIRLMASTTREYAMGGSTNRVLYGSAESTPSFGSALRAQVTYGAVDHFAIAAPRKLQVNEDATIRITAVDRDGNRVEDYSGTVLLSSTDPSAFLPISGRVPFRAQDLGEKQLTLGLRFRTAGEHILHVEDAENPSVMSEVTMTVLGGNTNQTQTKLIKITEPKNNLVTNESVLTIIGSTEPFVNLIVTGGTKTVYGESDIQGAFSIQVDLETGKEKQTFRVTDETGLLDSGEFTVQLDTTPPAIYSVSLSPENPVEGSDALLVVEADTDLVNIQASVDDKPIVLDEAPGQKGKFQSLFSVEKSGTHAVRITVEDAAGNSDTRVMPFQVALKGLPKITGLTVDTVGDAVELRWNPLASEPVDAYRIYVGETPTEFAFSLDSDRASTTAQIAGLQPGTEFFFAVTALKGERESEEKSDIVSSTISGMRLDVQAKNNALLLDWSNMQTTIPLSSFILEYGVEPDIFIEKRILNGNLRTATLRDLLNEVTYFLQLTPVSVTGEILEKLIATSEGKLLKTAAGFQPTPADLIPFSILSQQTANVNPPPNLHQSAPATPSTGVPDALLWILVVTATGICVLRWKRKKTLQQTVEFFESMENRYSQYQL
jgi:hypothetical protein